VTGYTRNVSNTIGLVDTVATVYGHRHAVSDTITLLDSGRPSYAYTLTNQYRPTTGDTAGGTEVNILGADFSMDAVEEGLLGGTIDLGLWSTTSTASGTVVTSVGRVELSSPAGSTAGVRTRTRESVIDVEATWIVVASDTQRDESTTIAALQLEGLTGTLTMAIQDRGPTAAIRPDNRVLTISGSSGLSIPVTEWVIGSLGRVNTTYSLRMLQYGRNVWFFLNGELWHQKSWNAGPCLISLETGAGASYSSCASAVDGYNRRPVVVFGENPSVTVTESSDVHIQCTPPAVANPVVVTPTVYTDYGNTYTLAPNYSYTRTSMLSWGISTDKVLTLTNDPVLRGVEVA